MGFKKRLNVLLKSQFNHWVTRAEDPEKIVNQVVQEMEEGLDRAREKLLVLKSRLVEEERLLGNLREQISHWQKRAEEFLKDDMEENVKDAVRRRRILEEEERKLKIKHGEDKDKFKEMETSLKELESRVQTAKVRRNILVKNIRLRKGVMERLKVGEEVGGVDFEEPFSVLRKMEDRVEDETEFISLKSVKEKEAWEKEEKLINEEIEILKRNIGRGGSKK
ncbi:MAG: PspA/IM30 family protein [Deltaproteobacteria bacterium]|nr:PspA/IM30 family protein [Deltaproteobacteria bacterium]